MKINTFK